MNHAEITALPLSTKRAIVDALNAVRVPLILASAPDETTEGRKGQLAFWVETGELEARYAICVKAEPGAYVWHEQGLVIRQETEPTASLFPGLLWVRPSTGEVFIRDPLNLGWSSSVLGETDSAFLRFDVAQSLSAPEQLQAQANIGLPKNNFTAITAPGLNDDSTQGYTAGSRWYNTVAREAYHCLFAGPGAADWQIGTLDPSDLGSAAFANTEEFAPAEGAPHNAGSTVTGDLSFDRADGPFQKATLTGGTVARVFNPPTNGNEGDYLTARVHSTTGVDRTLDFDATIRLPSDSLLSLPKSLTAGKTYIIKLYHNGTDWELISLVGGY